MSTLYPTNYDTRTYVFLTHKLQLLAINKLSLFSKKLIIV